MESQYGFVSWRSYHLTETTKHIDKRKMIDAVHMQGQHEIQGSLQIGFKIGLGTGERVSVEGCW